MRAKDRMDLLKRVRAYVRACGGDPDSGNVLEKSNIEDGIEDLIDKRAVEFASFAIGFSKKEEEASLPVIIDA
jgi:hypothetical protein